MAGLVTTVAPSGEPVSLAEAKAWLRIDVADEDVLIMSLIEAARGHVETFTRRALVTQQLEQSFDAVPLKRCIALPRPPLVSVQSIKYYDSAGTLQTFSADGYYVDPRSQPGRIVLNEDYDWPEVVCRPNALIVAYTAGYGTASQIPQGLRTAMRFLLTHWFENRAHVNLGNIVSAIPDTVETLLWQHRIAEAY